MRKATAADAAMFAPQEAPAHPHGRQRGGHQRAHVALNRVVHKSGDDLLSAIARAPLAGSEGPRRPVGDGRRPPLGERHGHLLGARAREHAAEQEARQGERQGPVGIALHEKRRCHGSSGRAEAAAAVPDHRPEPGRAPQQFVAAKPPPVAHFLPWPQDVGRLPGDGSQVRERLRHGRQGRAETLTGLGPASGPRSAIARRAAHPQRNRASTPGTSPEPCSASAKASTPSTSRGPGREK